ncbi:hypothetical protein K0M31_004496 [Melipona bicolor]|uniref:Uncharacterized protein n=1 Tax=Melipona bicolor TaxID=60889 RepID=A0AA40KNM1_9HYME|nr:hypothetical protein K0M31_004496 [Melipona bicolor]
MVSLARVRLEPPPHLAFGLAASSRPDRFYTFVSPTQRETTSERAHGTVDPACGRELSAAHSTAAAETIGPEEEGKMARGDAIARSRSSLVTDVCSRDRTRRSSNRFNGFLVSSRGVSHASEDAARELDHCSVIKYSAQEPDRSSASAISGKDLGRFRPGRFLFSARRSNEAVI